MLQSKIIRYMVGITLGVLIALMIAPQTRWLMRYQALATMHLTPAPGEQEYHVTDFESQNSSRYISRLQPRVQSAAQRNPDNCRLQMAAATWLKDDPEDGAVALRALEPKFPESASLRANILRQASDNLQFDDENEVNYLLGEAPEPKSVGPGAKIAIRRTELSQLAAFQRDAIIGERLDPQNAYFPLMLAFAEYCGGDDAAAHAAVLRAGSGDTWDDYEGDAIVGEWRLSRMVGVDSSVLSKQYILNNETPAESFQLLETSNRTVYDVIHLELAGHVQAGIALRQALLHTAELVREHSDASYGILVSNQMSRTAMRSPGHTPVADSTLSRATTEDRVDAADLAQFKQLQSVYTGFLRQHGDAVDGVQATAEGNAAQTSMAVILAYLNSARPAQPINSLTNSWATGLVLLAALLCLLLVCLAVGYGIKLPLLSSALQAARFAATMIGVVALIFLFGTICWWVSGPANQLYVERNGSFLGSYTVSQLSNYVEIPSPVSIFLSLHAVLCVAVMAVPVLVLLLAASLRKWIPFQRALVSATVPFACALAIAYGFVLTTTTHQERTLNSDLTAQMSNFGQYAAAQTGQPWPGPTPLTPTSGASAEDPGAIASVRVSSRRARTLLASLPAVKGQINAEK